MDTNTVTTVVSITNAVANTNAAVTTVLAFIAAVGTVTMYIGRGYHGYKTGGWRGAVNGMFKGTNTPGDGSPKL